MLFLIKAQPAPRLYRETTQSEAKATHLGVLHQLQALRSKCMTPYLEWGKHETERPLCSGRGKFYGGQPQEKFL